MVCPSRFVVFLFLTSYDNDGTSRDEVKERFSQTMEFVENYLRDVVCQSFPFSDKEKNKLTFEVCYFISQAHYRLRCIKKHQYLSGTVNNVRFLFFLHFLTLFSTVCSIGGKPGKEPYIFWLL